MGRPLNKKYFGNRNVGGVGGESVESVTTSGANTDAVRNVANIRFVVNAPTIPSGVTATVEPTTIGVTSIEGLVGGSGYVDGEILTLASGGGNTAGVDAQVQVNGVTGGNIDDLTLHNPGAYTVRINKLNGIALTGGSGSGATVDVKWGINGFVLTDGGSGYTSAPNITVTGVTLTATASITTDHENAINGTAWVGTGPSTADIVKQTGNNRYIVTTNDGDGEVVLSDSTSFGTGQMLITATDSEGRGYYVTKITDKHCWMVSIGGRQFGATASGQKINKVRWTFGDAVENEMVKIANA